MFRDDEHTATESNENHTHDNVPDVLIRLAELDHKPDTENGERHAPEQAVHLQLAVVPQTYAVYERDEARAHSVDVRNVRCVRNGLVEHDAQQGVEVRVPDVPADVQRAGHGVCEDDGAVLEQRPRDECYWCAPLLPETEGDDQEAAEDDEADDHRGFPLVGLQRVQVEGEEEERETGCEDEQTNDVEFFGIIHEFLTEGAAVGARGDQALTTRFRFVEVEHCDERGADEGCEDGKDAEAPAPADAAGCDDAVDRIAVDPGRDEPRGCGIADKETSILELRRVGNEDCHGEVDAIVAGVEEGVGGAIRLDIVAARHEDKTEHVACNADTERERPAPDVHDLGIGELPDTGDNRGDDTCQGGKRVLLKGAGNVGRERAAAAGCEGHEEVDEPHAT